MRNRWLLLGMICGMFFTAACSDDTTPIKYDTGDVDMDVTEAGVDMAVDMGVETAPDIGVDTAVVDTGADMAPPDAADDMAGDMATSDATADATTADVTTSDATTSDATTSDMATTDAATGDGPVGDAAPPKKAWVLYGVNSSSTKYTLNQVNIDGTGQQLFGNTPANIQLCDLRLTGNVIYQDVDQTKPVQVAWAGEEYIRLPNGSRLYHWYDGTDYGLGLLATDGTFEAPVNQQARAGASSSCTASYYIDVSKDGKLAAVVLEGTKVALVKLDGTTWTGTTPASAILDITPTGTTNISTIYDNSLTLGAKSLLFVVDETGGNDALYAAPLDGSAKATKVTLPQVDSKVPVYLNPYMITNAAGDHFAIVAGASSSKEGVIVYKDSATPTLTLVSSAVANFVTPGAAFMDSLQPKIAFSPSGKYIAFTTTTSDKKLFISTTDGVTKSDLSNQFSQVSSGTNVDNFGAFHWTDEDNLIFWAGESSTSAGLYHFKASTKAVKNLLGSSSTASPWDGGNYNLDGGWLAPGGKILYILAGTSSSAINIWKIDLTALTATAVTTGLDVDSGSYMDTGFEVVPNSNLVAFIAKADTNTSSPYFYDLYVFDQSTGATTSVKKLTSTPTTGTSSININNILPSPDGKYVGYNTNSGATELLTIVPTAGGASTALNGTGSYLEDAYWWTPDSASVVYGGGTSSSKLDLKIVPVTGGASTTLHAAQSYLYVFGVYQ